MQSKLKDHLKDLVNDLERFVNELDFIRPDPAVLELFRKKVRSIQEKLNALDEPLFIALIGGTGVGKSALINALAGKVISKSSAKRGFTDHKVFFCHQKRIDQILKYPFFHPGRDEISSHKEFSLEEVVLVDLPDIDSDEPSHPQQVNEMIPHADIVIWMVDHEKYNDEVLHEKYLSVLANYQKSFIFVFNRIDELLENKPNRKQARESLERIVDHFLEVLKEEGYPNLPRNRIFRISAKRALQSKQGEAKDFSENEFGQLEKLIRDQVTLKQMGQIKFLEDIHSLFLDLKTLLHFEKGWEMIQKCRYLLTEASLKPSDRPQTSSPDRAGMGSLASIPKIVEDRVVDPLFTRDFRRTLEDVFMNRIDLLMGGPLGFMISFKFRLFSPFYLLRQITSDFKGYLQEFAATFSGQGQEKDFQDVSVYLDKWEALMDLGAIYHRLNTLLRDIKKEWESVFSESGSRGVGGYGSVGTGEYGRMGATSHTSTHPYTCTPIHPPNRDQIKKLLETEKEKLKASLKESYTQLSGWEKWRSRQHLFPLLATLAAVGIPALSYISRISLYEIHLDEILLHIQSLIFSLISVPLLSYFIEALVLKRRIRHLIRREQDKLREQVQKDILKSLEDHILRPVEILLTKYETTLQRLESLEKTFQEIRFKIST
ncbi:MAG TPA: GTPase [Candidatus Limnocylindrales bacterium]|nr:GTPase [Candidatus Limnocylindrales bacterium]